MNMNFRVIIIILFFSITSDLFLLNSCDQLEREKTNCGEPPKSNFENVKFYVEIVLCAPISNEPKGFIPDEFKSFFLPYVSKEQKINLLPYNGILHFTRVDSIKPANITLAFTEDKVPPPLGKLPFQKIYINICSELSSLEIGERLARNSTINDSLTYLNLIDYITKKTDYKVMVISNDTLVRSVAEFNQFSIFANLESARDSISKNYKPGINYLLIYHPIVFKPLNKKNTVTEQHSVEHSDTTKNINYNKKPDERDRIKKPDGRNSAENPINPNYQKYLPENQVEDRITKLERRFNNVKDKLPEHRVKPIMDIIDSLRRWKRIYYLEEAVFEEVERDLEYYEHK